MLLLRGMRNCGLDGRVRLPNRPSLTGAVSHQQHFEDADTWTAVDRDFRDDRYTRSGAGRGDAAEVRPDQLKPRAGWHTTRAR